jgi:transposase
VPAEFAKRPASRASRVSHAGTFLDVAAVAARFGVTVATVLQWIHSGELRALNVARKPSTKKPRWRVSEEALAEFEVSRSHEPPILRVRRPHRRREQGVVEFYKT